MQARIGTMKPGSEKILVKLLDCCMEELPVPGFYDYHMLAKRLGCSPPEIAVVLSRITAEGYPASRTHFSGYGIKTKAPLSVIFDAIRGPGQE
jgi:tRNA (guanine26-N2/guanine27-N2)-dimethyltransferase